MASELGRLLHVAGLGQLGKDVWLIIAGYMDMHTACHFAASCRAGLVLLQVDAHNERRFAREKARVTVLRSECTTWLERFGAAEVCGTLREAALLQDSIRTIVLCPAVHTLDTSDDSVAHNMPRAIVVDHKIQILGCCFNQNYSCVSPAIRRTEQVPSFGPPSPNIVITSSSIAPVVWRASGGSIRNVQISFVTASAEAARPAVVLSQRASLEMENCGISSAHQTGLFVGSRATLVARACRFYHCKANGLGFASDEPEDEVVTCERCSFDNNGLSGAEVTGAKAQFRECIFWGNRFNGCGLHHELVTMDGNERVTKSVVLFERCNFFANGLNGVDVTPLASGGVVSNCNIERNWRGVRIYSADPDCLVMIDCSVSDNTHADVLVKTVALGVDVVAAADAEGTCTFAVTGPHYFWHQNSYRCLTCFTEDEGCCRACSVTCHRGHQIEADFGSAPPFMCDCACGSSCHFSERITEDVIGRNQRKM